MGWFRKSQSGANSNVAAAAASMLARSFDQETQSKLSGGTLDATNGILATYWDHDVDWQGLWALASSQDEAARRIAPVAFDLGSDRGIPPYADSSHWILLSGSGRAVPETVLAFWGVRARARIAQDPDTDNELLQILANDPAGEVRTFARMRLGPGRW